MSMQNAVYIHEICTGAVHTSDASSSLRPDVLQHSLLNLFNAYDIVSDQRFDIFFYSCQTFCPLQQKLDYYMWRCDRAMLWTCYCNNGEYLTQTTHIFRSVCHIMYPCACVCVFNKHTHPNIASHNVSVFLFDVHDTIMCFTWIYKQRSPIHDHIIRYTCICNHLCMYIYIYIQSHSLLTVSVIIKFIIIQYRRV